MKSEDKFRTGDHIAFAIDGEMYNGSFVRYNALVSDMCTIENIDVIERTCEMPHGADILLQPGNSIVMRVNDITPVSHLKENNPNISFKKRKRVCWRCGRKVARYLMKRRIYEHRDTGNKVPFCHDCAAIIEREKDSTNIQENNNKWIARE